MVINAVSMLIIIYIYIYTHNQEDIINEDCIRLELSKLHKKVDECTSCKLLTILDRDCSDGDRFSSCNFFHILLTAVKTIFSHIY